MFDKLDGLSKNLETENMKKLKAIFPECFNEGNLDIDKLLSLCGEYITNDFEKYKFEWKGKSECLQLAQRRSSGTLRPKPEESVNFDETQNLYIKGDNLEVLKLLQSSYYRQVKMIYIDPPYNTGNDFVYEDDFTDPMARYKEVTQQTTKSNPETMGRFHTNWLNMMYPRLRLAANLLRDDGVIFISIDDNEVHNLRKVCDEVFGEENFIADIIWEKRFTRNNDAKLISSVFDHLIFYRKSDAVSLIREPRSEKANSIYSNPDNDPRGPWTSVSYVSQRTKDQRPNLSYDMINPITGHTVSHPVNAWKYSKEQYDKHVAENRLHWGKTGENTYPRLKRFLSELNDGMVPVNLWNYKEVGTLDDGTKVVDALLGKDIFDYPKPITLIKKMLQVSGSSDNDIILDFFSGSATTAHAVLQLNAEDGGNRQFVMVQLPEICDENSEAYKAGYKTICDIGMERIRRAGQKILSEQDNQMKLGEEEKLTLDIGFKVFELDTSNLKTWDSTPILESEQQILIERMNQMLDRVKPDRSDMDMVYEIMLKIGLPLTERIDTVDIQGKTAYSVGDDCLLLICLAEELTPEMIEEMCDYAPAKLIIGEKCLSDAAAMANAHYICKDKDIDLKLV